MLEESVAAWIRKTSDTPVSLGIQDGNASPGTSHPRAKPFFIQKQSKIRKFVKFIDYTIRSPAITEHRHAPILISGDNSQRKTALALYIALYLSQIRGTDFDLAKHIYYTSIEGLTDELLTTWRQIRIVDEGYFGGTNLESNLPRVVELGAAMNAIRNRGHTIIFIYSKLNRATKMLLESTAYWFHKPHPDYALLFIKDREFVGNDPWGIDPLLKAQTKAEKRKEMVRNPNYIETMEMPYIQNKIFDEYEKQKALHQEEYQKLKISLRQSAIRQKAIVDSLKADYYSPHPPFTLENMREYLMRKGFSRPTAKKYYALLKDEIIEEGIVNSQQQLASAD
jgi:hypothetical protein